MNAENSESSASFESDELLDRAVTELRDMAIPAGPSMLLLGKTRSALAISRREMSKPQPFMLRPAFLSLAAAVAILCAAVAIYRFGFHHAPVELTHGPVPHNPAPIFPVEPSHVGAPVPTPIVKAPSPVVPEAVAFAPGLITGRVLFDGVAPAPAPLSAINMMPECQKAHGGTIYDESLVVGADGTMANVVVSVSSGLSGWLREEFPPPASPAVLNQKGCVFEPHVVAMMVGEALQIKNSDPFLHNVHILAVNNPESNMGQPTIGELATEPLQSPEVFRVRCDVHPWMQAWVRVLDNPFFAVTGRDGKFSLRGLPPGTYTLKAWHEQLGIREAQVTIGADQGASVDFVFKPVP